MIYIDENDKNVYIKIPKTAPKSVITEDVIRKIADEEIEKVRMARTMSIDESPENDWSEPQTTEFDIFEILAIPEERREDFRSGKIERLEFRNMTIMLLAHQGGAEDTQSALTYGLTSYDKAILSIVFNGEESSLRINI